MRLVTDEQIDELIRLNRLRAADDRLTPYSRDLARETIAALTELQVHRKGIPVEGVVS